MLDINLKLNLTVHCKGNKSANPVKMLDNI
jgi:hypothetical protein